MARLSRLITGLAFGTLTACAADTPSIAVTDPSPDYATAPLDLSTPEAAAYSMMIAMYRGDAGMVDNIFLEGATLRRVKADGSVEHDGLQRWRDWVSTLETGQAYEEIFGLKTQQFENLATVWAPFVITFKGEIAGCGVNQLSMVRTQGDWRVVSGMDTQAPKESCPAFKETYLAGN